MTSNEIELIVQNYGLKQGLREHAFENTNTRSNYIKQRLVVFDILLEVMQAKLEAAGVLGYNGCVADAWVRTYEIGYQAGKRGLDEVQA